MLAIDERVPGVLSCCFVNINIALSLAAVSVVVDLSA